LPTTTRSSEPRGSSPARRRLLPLLLPVLAFATGCSRTPPEEFFQLTPESAAHRAAQTRMFETPGDDELLSASAAVLQDLGFQVSESVRELGFLRAAKERSAREYGQEIWRGVLFTLSILASAGGQNAITLLPVDLHQQVNASLVVRPLNQKGDRQEVRILFYRLVWKSDGQSGASYIAPGEQKMEMIRDPKIYQLFFARLSKAVFLEAHKI
jgi:hypothetical protein